MRTLSLLRARCVEAQIIDHLAARSHRVQSSRTRISNAKDARGTQDVRAVA